MDISLILAHLFPEADPTGDYIVLDGEIAVWNLDTPQPTPAELEAAWIPTLKELRKAELSRSFAASCVSLYPSVEPEYAIWLAIPEMIASPNGMRPKAVRDNVSRLANKLAAVDAATTEEQINAVVW